MTNREFFTTIANMTNINSELVEFATAAIEKIDKANASRSAKPSKAHEANVAFIPTVTEYLSVCTVPVPASAVAENCGLTSASKATAILKLMVENGTVKTEKIKSTAKSGGKVNGYILVRE